MDIDDIERTLSQARFVHLRDHELAADHDDELGSFPLARAKAHRKLCLICERRAEALASSFEIVLPEAMPSRPSSVNATRTRQPSPVTRNLSIAVVSRQKINIHSANGILTLGLIDFVINRLGKKRRSGDVQFTVRPLSAVLSLHASLSNSIEVGKELQTDRVLTIDCVRRVGQNISFTSDLTVVEKRTAPPLEKSVEDWGSGQPNHDSISEKELRRINLRLTKAEQKRLADLQTSSPSADVACTLGRFYLNRFPGSALEKATECFTRAVALNDRMAEAHSGLADCSIMRGIYNISPPADSYKMAFRQAKKALAINRELAEAHTSLAYTHMCYEWDWARAKEEYDKAIEHNSCYAMAYQGYAHLLGALGEFDEAIRMSDRALAIDPVSPMIYVVRAFIFYYAGCDEKAKQHLLIEAREQCRRALSVNRRFDPAWYVDALICVQLALTHREKGQVIKAEKYFEAGVEAAKKARDFTHNLQKDALITFCYLMWGKDEDAMRAQEGLDAALIKNSYISPYHMALVHVAKGKMDDAFKSLGKGLRLRDQWMILMRHEPAFTVLREDKRFKKLVLKLKFPNTQEDQ